MRCNKCGKKIPKNHHFFFGYDDKEDQFFHKECYEKMSEKEKEFITDDYNMVEWEYDDDAD